MPRTRNTVARTADSAVGGGGSRGSSKSLPMRAIGGPGRFPAADDPRSATLLASPKRGFEAIPLLRAARTEPAVPLGGLPCYFRGFRVSNGSMPAGGAEEDSPRQPR